MTVTADGGRVAALLSRPFDELDLEMSFVTRGRTITEADVVSFAALTGDFHPQHVDASWSEDSLFGERVAHGLLVVSYAVGLVPFDPDYVVALRRFPELIFKRPVLIGDTIRVHGRIVRLRELDPDNGLVGFKLKMMLADGRAAVLGEADTIWKRLPQAASKERA